MGVANGWPQLERVAPGGAIRGTTQCLNSYKVMMVEQLRVGGTFNRMEAGSRGSSLRVRGAGRVGEQLRAQTWSGELSCSELLIVDCSVMASRPTWHLFSL